jgi:imidazolonepropionase-like amidohydrolase
MICITGGHGWIFGGREADGPDEVCRAVREQIKAGVDVVKLMATGGVLTPGVEAGSPQLTEEELRAGIEEANKAGRKTATHAMGTQGILNALRAGIGSIEHGTFLDEEAISLMLKRDVPLIPTLVAVHKIDSEGISAGIPSWVVEKNRRNKPFHLESVRLAREAGVRVAMGTDAGTPFNMHGQNLAELQCLVEAGYSNIKALESGTRISAQVLGLEKVLGTIEVGKLATLIVVEDNPIEDVGVLLKAGAICLVMQEGKVVKGEKEKLSNKGGFR